MNESTNFKQPLGGKDNVAAQRNYSVKCYEIIS